MNTLDPQILDPEIYERAKEIVYKQYDKSSAYRSGALVQKYIQLGGRYVNSVKKSNTDLNKEYPVYRQTKKVKKQNTLKLSELDANSKLKKT